MRRDKQTRRGKKTPTRKVKARSHLASRSTHPHGGRSLAGAGRCLPRRAARPRDSASRGTPFDHLARTRKLLMEWGSTPFTE